jgi:lipopolysaccharide transport system ATP-binding protein
MSDTVIRVENLSKRYVLSHQQEGRSYKALRDVIADGAKSLLKPFNSKSKGARLSAHAENQNPKSEEFWALKGVSFEINQGDRVGIIGRNGAGKSTLLKILSRIVEPTQGSIRIKGRVASLLEVGTGFHPELTGRENIFLNGAILGMSKVEITRKFDEIVAFAEVEKFLDTPVKRYSSGMYVRLAFAVAAHLEPEILIVDEVLAVGDSNFQKKCLGKMQEVGQSGRTILFVSHNMSTIQSLCTRCVLLHSGNVISDSDPATAMQLYLQDASTSANFVREKQKNGKPTLVSGKVLYNPDSNDLEAQIDLEIFSEKICKAAIDLRLSDSVGVPIGRGSLGSFRPSQIIELHTGINKVSFKFSIRQLAIGTYFISLDLSCPWIEFYDQVEKCLLLDVIRPPMDDATLVLPQSWGQGSLEIPLEIVK